MSERARYGTLYAELDALDERLRPVIDAGQARPLMLAIVDALLRFFGAHSLGPVFDSGVAEVATLFAIVKAVVATGSHDFGAQHKAADRLAARYFRPMGWHGLFPPDVRVPFELAGLLRRATSPEPWRMVALVIRDGHALVIDAGGPVALVFDIVVDAIARATGADIARPSTARRALQTA